MSVRTTTILETCAQEKNIFKSREFFIGPEILKNWSLIQNFTAETLREMHKSVRKTQIRTGRCLQNCLHV